MAFKVSSFSYNPALIKPVLLDNSTTYEVGMLVSLKSDVVSSPTVADLRIIVPAQSTKKVLGVLLGFVKSDGNVIGQGGQRSITTAADNTTTGAYYGLVHLVTRETRLEADFTAALGTTTGSDRFGAKFALSDAKTVDESSVGVSETGKDVMLEEVGSVSTRGIVIPLNTVY